MDRNEYSVLKKFGNGCHVNREDKYQVMVLNKYASIGCVRFGSSITNSEIQETASLTERGRISLRIDKDSRMPRFKKEIFRLLQPFL